MKFKETRFPAKELKLTQSILVSLDDHQFPESDNESDSSGLDPVTLTQPPTPQQTALRPPSPPTPHAPRRPHTPLPDAGTTPKPPVAPQYSLCQTKAREQRQLQPGSSTSNINKILIHMFQEVPNSYREAMASSDSDKWLAASTEEFEGLRDGRPEVGRPTS